MVRKQPTIQPTGQVKPFPYAPELMPSLHSLSRCTHAVQFYEEQRFLIDNVSQFLAHGLALSEAVLAIVDGGRIAPLKLALEQRGVDVAKTIEEKRLVILDAEETLSKFMVQEWPDSEMIQAVMGTLLGSLQAEFGKVHAYAEIVNTLWLQGKYKATLQLEREWNKLSEKYSFSLLCGYLISGFQEENHTHLLEEICAIHQMTLPTEDFSRLTQGEDQRRAIAILQQKATILERQLKERIIIENDLRQRTYELKMEVDQRRKAETLLKTRERELTRSNAELERFAHIASHDLKEPLRAVRSYVQLLDKHYGNQLDTDGKQFIGFAVEGTRRMQALVDDLLTYSSVETDRQSQFERIDCKELVQEVITGLRTSINERDASLEIGTLPVLIANRSQLTQLFQNLISNALKFRSPHPPVIKIDCEKKGSYYQFKVEDNGIGIAKEYFDRVFVLFQRLHESYRYPGTGMGLAICKKIVDRHGGRIWLESQLGKGTTFFFALPGHDR